MNKTTRIISIVLMTIPALMLVMSAIMKIAGAEEIVTGLGGIGLGKYVLVFGLIELIAVALFLYPKTTRIGFLLLCSYLGGAMSIELAGAQFPMAGVFLALIWASMYLRNKSVFIANTGEVAR